MNQDFSEHQVLVDLGLTLTQAKVYLALVESGTSKISEIAKKSNVARPDVYQAISKLQQFQLVEKIIVTPLQYRALPIKEGLLRLLKTKTEQYEKVQADTKVLLEAIKNRKKSDENHVTEHQFVLIPQGNAVIERIRTAIEKAKKSMDLALTWKRFSHGMVCAFAESMEIAWVKKVKIRFIVESPSKSRTADELIKFCREKPFCQIRFTPHFPRTVIGIYDKKEIFVIANPKTDLPGSAALWSNNASLIALAEDYFEVLCRTAKEDPVQ